MNTDCDFYEEIMMRGRSEDDHDVRLAVDYCKLFRECQESPSLFDMCEDERWGCPFHHDDSTSEPYSDMSLATIRKRLKILLGRQELFTGQTRDRIDDLIHLHQQWIADRDR